MKTNDIFPAIAGRKDDKARRRLNVAPTVTPNITAEQLEAGGASLEMLQSCGAPILLYGTQLTVHGIFPDFNPAARIGGYKHLARNANGSLGVRYGAIDAGKKALVARAIRASYCRGDKGPQWGAQVTSKGLELQCTFHGDRKQDAIDFAKSQAGAAALVYGSLYGLTLPWGAGYMVCLYVGAIPNEALWQFIEAVCGVKDEAGLIAAETAYKAREDARRAEMRAYLEKRADELRAERLASSAA